MFDALDILSFSKKASSKNLKKLLESAIANAEHNKGLDVDNLFISEISVDEAFIKEKELNLELEVELTEFKRDPVI